MPALVARDFTQCELPQRSQIARFEKIPESLLDTIGGIDFAFTQTLAQFFHGDINRDDLVGACEKDVRNSLPDFNSSHSPHHLVKAFEMLDVEGSDYADSVSNQLLHILVALVMVRARRVGMSQLIDNRKLRLACQDGLDIHLLQGYATIWNLSQWYRL